MRKESFSSLFNLTLIILSVCFQMSCTEPVTTNMSNESLIPLPASVIATGDTYHLTNETKIFINSDDMQLNRIAAYLANTLRPATGFDLGVETSASSPGDGHIYLQLNKEEEFVNEAYKLEIATDYVSLSASTPDGIFRGLQTIRQLLPPEIESPSKLDKKWTMATGTIVDYPAYNYRGLMLDVSRHFFGVDVIKKYIDYLSAYKMNVLHLHLTDDQGWRIEIKSWPKLTEIGGSTEVGGGDGGFYTQEEFKEIVAYANERFVTIVPEFEIPGHSNAALAAYPELNCDGKARELYTGIEVGFSTVCTKNEVTYKFVEDVVRELSEISPGPYLHIGGDESLSTEKEDYISFMNRVQGIVAKYNKKMIGWEEIAQADLNPGTIVQFWANPEHMKPAIEKGAQILMSPAKKIYLDMQYDSTTPLGLHWAAYIEVDDAYMWDPATYAKDVSAENILGIEAPLWSETIENLDDIEYMIFPRMPGYAEIGWTTSDKRDWQNYKVRLGMQAPRFRIMNINFYPSAKIDWTE